MSLARRNLPEGSKVLIIDDFMKAGGTVQGMKDLLHEFNAEVVGVRRVCRISSGGAPSPRLCVVSNFDGGGFAQETDKSATRKLL